MKSITSVNTLHEAIAALEIRRSEQERSLSNQFMIVRDRLKPVNILKNTVLGLIESTNVNSVMGLVTGYIFRKLFLRSRSGTLKKILGTVLQFGITNLVRKKGNTITAGGSQFLRNNLVGHNHNGSQVGV